jgi:hypothetical protein
MHVKYEQDNLHCKTWYTGTCGIMAMGLLHMLALWPNVCVLYGPRIQWLFMVGAALTGDHYRTDIIRVVYHLRSDLAIL